MKRLSRNLVGMLIMLILLSLMLVGIYVIGMRYYASHFFTGTAINGVDVSGMTVDEAKYQLQDRIREYSLTCKERSSQVEAITGSQIYMQYVDDGSVDKLMKDQKEILWPFAFLGGKKLNANIGFTYDKNTIENVMDQMRCFQSENVTAPTAAHIENDGTKYFVKEATQGTLLNYDSTRDAIMRAIEAGDTEIDFESLDLYVKPKNADKSEQEMQAKADQLNNMFKADLYYDFVDRVYKIDREVMEGFVVEDENGEFELSEEAVSKWVYDMAYQTDTYGMKRTFRTTSGREIELAGGGDYGWCINQPATVRELMEAIRNGQSGELTPVYLEFGIAKDRSANDIGDTYIEISIEEQHMWVYKDGSLVVDTPVVTGSHAAGWDTPSGSVWAVDAHMKDKQFASVKVDYLIAFNDQCAIHDSKWRNDNEYGGTTWQYNGSHGCVNTPLKAVEKVYDAVYLGDPVIIYYSLDEPVGPEPTGPITVG